MVKAVIFDLDGTLVDTVESIAHTANTSLQALGYPKLPVENFKFYAGDGAGTLLKRVLKEVGDSQYQDYEKIKEKYFYFFPQYCTYKVVPYPGIKNLLKRLQESNIKITILTNKPQHIAALVLEKIFPDISFDMVIGQKEGYPKKPNPQGIYDILQTFKIESSQALYVGDTDTDMQTALGGNVYSIGVLWGFRSRQELEDNQASAIVERAEQILEIVGER